MRAISNNYRDHIFEIVSNISPFDNLENQQKQETLQWILSGEPLCRIKKPDTPAKHLVSYFVVLDKAQQKILLVDHKNACLWLPSGGHVEIDELPNTTVQRECVEELGIAADFCYNEPIFLTTTTTVGLTAGHTDVSLWYVINGDATAQIKFDKDEFNDIQWFDFDEIPFEKSDPHMKRFIKKLRSIN